MNGEPPETKGTYAIVPRGWLAGAPISRALIAVNVAVFVAQIAVARSADAVVNVPHRESLAFGANYAAATFRDLRLETLVTAMFLHGGIIHLALNMVVLAQAGPLVEYAAGGARMLPLFLFSGIVSSAFSALAPLVSPGHDLETYSVGASGAIMGVCAAALVLGWRAQGWKGALTQSMARWIGLMLVVGFLANQKGANIDNAAHVGGAIAGALVALTWRRGQARSPEALRRAVAVFVSVVVASAACVVARDASDPYVALLGDERLDVVRGAVSSGDCRTAHAALVSVERIYPRAAPVARTRASYEGRCGGAG